MKPHPDSTAGGPRGTGTPVNKEGKQIRLSLSAFNRHWLHNVCLSAALYRHASGSPTSCMHRSGHGTEAKGASAVLREFNSAKERARSNLHEPPDCRSLSCG